jgi:hypothetical protein
MKTRFQRLSDTSYEHLLRAVARNLSLYGQPRQHAHIVRASARERLLEKKNRLPFSYVGCVVLNSIPYHFRPRLAALRYACSWGTQAVVGYAPVLPRTAYACSFPHVLADSNGRERSRIARSILHRRLQTTLFAFQRRYGKSPRLAGSPKSWERPWWEGKSRSLV